ncbi:MAG TPA: cystathionine beta-lyase [Aliidongia sp.]|nr:cystathionine beta-lyase [Aliidongia sp.]
MSKDLKPASRLVHAGRVPRDYHGAVNPPIYRASTILQPTLEAWEASRQPGYKGLRYGVVGTPTTLAFEEAMAEIYGVDHCVATSSGLAAVTTALLALTKAGDHLLMTDSAYDPTRRFCDAMLKHFGVAVEYYDPRIGAGIADLIRPETSLVYTESPGSLTFEIQDIPAIVAAAHAKGAKVALDNTWATALLFNPFEHGVDVVIEAVTKYVAGHADVLMGVVLAKGNLGRVVHSTAKMLGNCCGPEELYLAQRGLRSMAVRLERCGATALILADWLATRPEVRRVLHPARPDHPDHALWRRDFRGASGLFSMLLEPLPRPALSAFFDGLRLFGIGASWGGYESLIMPADPARTRTAVPWTETGHLIRLHAGLEDPDDLMADLEAGFERAVAQR